eukprot:2678982-Alexandrium_andersonii.AAC.1
MRGNARAAAPRQERAALSLPRYGIEFRATGCRGSTELAMQSGIVGTLVGAQILRRRPPRRLRRM